VASGAIDTTRCVITSFAFMTALHTAEKVARKIADFSAKSLTQINSQACHWFDHSKNIFRETVP
jgi:hypothetical protein